MSIANLAKGKSATVSLLPPSTARILAAKSAPLNIVEQIIERASAGDLVSDSTVKSMIADDKMARWQAKHEAQAAGRKSKKGANARKAAAEELRQNAEQRRVQQERRARAQSIYDRFSPKDNAFLANAMTWDILEEYKRLVSEFGTA